MTHRTRFIKLSDIAVAYDMGDCSISLSFPINIAYIIILALESVSMLNMHMHKV